VNTANI